MEAIREINEKLEDLRRHRKDALRALQLLRTGDRKKFDLSVEVPDLGYSIADVDMRVGLISDFVLSLKFKETSFLISDLGLTEATKAVESLTASYREITNELIESDAFDIRNVVFDYDVLVISGGDEESELRIGDLFIEIYGAAEGFLEAFQKIRAAYESEGSGDFSDTLIGFVEAYSALEKNFEELVEKVDRVSESLTEAEEQKNRVAQFAEESEEALAAAQKGQEEIAECQVQVTASVEKVSDVQGEAERLEEMIGDYTDDFTRFQEELDGRIDALQEGSKKQLQLEDRLKEASSNIEDMTARAEGMLEGATVAGLAGAFERLRSDTANDLKTARRTFYFAIGFLFLSVIPLMTYIFPGLNELFGLASGGVDAASVADDPSGNGDQMKGADTPASFIELIGQVAVRALLLLPAAWFTKFAAARHAALFRLQEHYAYKYSVASSVEGFKQQAPDYEEEIAAATFFELTFNPAEKMEASDSGDRNPNRAMDWVMEKMGATHDGEASS